MRWQCIIWCCVSYDRNRKCLNLDLKTKSLTCFKMATQIFTTIEHLWTLLTTEYLFQVLFFESRQGINDLGRTRNRKIDIIRWARSLGLDAVEVSHLGTEGNGFLGVQNPARCIIKWIIWDALPSTFVHSIPLWCPPHYPALQLEMLLLNSPAFEGDDRNQECWWDGVFWFSIPRTALKQGWAGVYEYEYIAMFRRDASYARGQH